jgi:ABC-type transporter Mla MlaB component
MNIVNTHREGTTLEVQVCDGFNLRIKNIIDSRISDNIDKLQIDLTRCDFVDSEAVIFLYKWQHSGKQLELINPPEIFFEILDILELSESWDLNYSTTETS